MLRIAGRAFSWPSEGPLYAVPDAAPPGFEGPWSGGLCVRCSVSVARELGGPLRDGGEPFNAVVANVVVRSAGLLPVTDGGAE